MAVQNFPFDSLSADNPDRAANSKIFADYLKSFFSDGIFPVLTQFPDMHQLAVRASNPAGMSVVVDTGMGLISGRQYAQDAERTLQIPAADTSLPRKDRIVLRMDLNTQYRNNELYVVTGTAASSPQPPALTRNNVVYELALATISVAANATSITAADITDERANTDVCGYVTNVLGQVDTSVINAQFQAFFEQTQENTADWEDAQQAAFTAWFDTIKGQLGEDAAGNLQNQIGALSNLTTSKKSNLVDAINEVNAKEPDVLDTMEEIDTNTDAGKVAGALAVKELSSDLGGLSFGQDAEGNWGYKPSGADAVIPFSSQVIGQAIWGNINAANKGYTQVDIGFRPKKLIGYTVDASNPSTLAIEVIYFNIWGNDDIVHRRAVSRYYDEVMGNDPNRLVITDTGFTMYNSGGLWVGKTFYYMAFRT